MHTPRHRLVLALTLGWTLIVQPVAAGSEREIPDGPLPEATGRMLDAILGNPDPSAMRRLAQKLSTEDLVLVMYRGDRSQRQVAFELAGYAVDPWPLLPYLASFMGASERQTASRAALALLTALEGVVARVGDSPDAVPGQIEQLGSQLGRVAAAENLDLDLRAGAIVGLRLLGQIAGSPTAPGAELFEDPEPAIRAAAMGMLSPPFDDERLAALAELASADQSLTLRGQAAALLCENALAHGVKQPSPDLTRLLQTTLGAASMPAEGVAPILACLRRFKPEARADLVSTALGHPDPRVKAYWEELEQGQP